MKVYFISGLGADEKVFGNLDLPGIEPVHLHWLPPSRNESIESYAKRMAARITEPDPVIVGLSFGGMLAVEIAKQIKVKKLILISSAKGKKELPVYFSLGKLIPIYKIIPLHVSSFTAPLFFYFSDIKTKEEKKIAKEMVNNSPKDFTRWAMHTIVNWTNETLPENTTHIHGTKDWLLPIWNIKADHRIEGGSHFMIFNKSKEISELLNQLLK